MSLLHYTVAKCDRCGKYDQSDGHTVAHKRWACDFWVGQRELCHECFQTYWNWLNNRPACSPLHSSR